MDNSDNVEQEFVNHITRYIEDKLSRGYFAAFNPFHGHPFDTRLSPQQIKDITNKLLELYNNTGRHRAEYNDQETYLYVERYVDPDNLDYDIK